MKLNMKAYLESPLKDRQATHLTPEMGKSVLSFASTGWFKSCGKIAAI